MSSDSDLEPTPRSSLFDSSHEKNVFPNDVSGNEDQWTNLSGAGRGNNPSTRNVLSQASFSSGVIPGTLSVLSVTEAGASGSTRVKPPDYLLSNAGASGSTRVKP